MGHSMQPSRVPWAHVGSLHPSAQERDTPVFKNHPLVCDCWVWSGFHCLQQLRMLLPHSCAVTSLAQSSQTCRRTQSFVVSLPVSLPACFCCCWDIDQGVQEENCHQFSQLWRSTNWFSRVSLQISAWLFLLPAPRVWHSNKTHTWMCNLITCRWVLRSNPAAFLRKKWVGNVS